MSSDARFTILITVLLAVLSGVAALLRYIIKGAYRWARTEERLEELMQSVKQLVLDKDTVHKEIIVTMREDRSATDRRLRWLEETVWTGGRKP